MTSRTRSAPTHLAQQAAGHSCSERSSVLNAPQHVAAVLTKHPAKDHQHRVVLRPGRQQLQGSRQASRCRAAVGSEYRSSADRLDRTPLERDGQPALVRGCGKLSSNCAENASAQPRAPRSYWTEHAAPRNSSPKKKAIVCRITACRHSKGGGGGGGVAAQTRVLKAWELLECRSATRKHRFKCAPMHGFKR